MKIDKNTAVTLRYKVSDTNGKALEESREPMVYVHGGYGNTFVEVGGHLQAQGEDGHAHTFTVMKIKGDKVMLDGNHPMAGKALRLNLQVTEVRAATIEEIAHGHVHGEHGHHH